MSLKIDREEIKELYKNGSSCGEIAKYYECNPETIRLRLKILDVNTSKFNDNMLCIYCNSSTQKHGKLKSGVKKYKCNNCGKTFNENTSKENKKREEKYGVIKKMYLEDNLSTTEIAKELNVSSTVIQRIIQKLGISKSISDGRRGKGQKTKLPVGTIIKLYKSGISSIEISDKVGCSKSSVLEILKDNGVERDNNYKYKHPKINEIKKLYQGGDSMMVVSEKLGIPYSTINHNLHKINAVRTEDKYRIGMDYDKYLEQLPAFKRYKCDIMKITNKQPINILDNYNKRGLAGKQGAYHLDHKYSIFEGFKQNVEPEIIGNINNLEFIPWRDNITKGSECSISEEELRFGVKS